LRQAVNLASKRYRQPNCDRRIVACGWPAASLFFCLTHIAFFTILCKTQITKVHWRDAMNALAAFERPALPVELRLQLATSFASGVKGTGGMGVQPRHGGGDQRPTITAWARGVD
jgi:hypothetical protein